MSVEDFIKHEEKVREWGGGGEYLYEAPWSVIPVVSVSEEGNVEDPMHVPGKARARGCSCAAIKI